MKLADNASRERLLALAARGAEGDIVRRGVLMHTIRHLEFGWRDAPREAGKICIYGFQGTVMNGSGMICVDILIAHDAWSGAVITSVVEVNHDNVVVADFIEKICGMFPSEYHSFVDEAYLMSSNFNVDIKALTFGYLSKGGLTKQELKEQIANEWRLDALGDLAHGNVDTLVEIRRAIMEWQRVHNCQNERDPTTESRGGIASTSKANEVKELVADITLASALIDHRSMRKLTKATKPFTPARRIEIAISSHQRKKGRGEEPISLEGISKGLHTSKVPQGKRRNLEGNGSAASERLIGEALACMRKQYSESQIDAANKLGVQQQQISLLERHPFSAGRDLMESFVNLYGEDIGDIEKMGFMEDDLARKKLMLLEYDREDAQRERRHADPDIQGLDSLLQLAAAKPNQP